MNAREREALIEAAVTPFRERDREGRIIPPPAWWDLPPDACEEAYRFQLVTREMEKAMDPAGRSGTARAVLARIMGMT